MLKPNYYIVEHNPNLFVVMSEVTNLDMWGIGTRKFKNFVAEATTRGEAEAIVKKLEGLDQ